MRDETGLWLGVRDFSLDHVPAKSRFGNKLTRSIFRIFYHVTISDTQTGLRGYPNCMTERLPWQPLRIRDEDAHSLRRGAHSHP